MTTPAIVLPTITLPIIGYHHSPLTQKFGTPRQPNLVAVPSHIKMITPYDSFDAFVGIEQFSHLWIMWQFHHNKPQPTFHPQVRPPRLGGNDKLGVFATRSMYRPSGIGLSVVKFDRLECDSNHRNTIIHISGADMIDSTPIIDIKPYLPYSDSISHATGFDKPVIRTVVCSDSAKSAFMQLTANDKLTEQDIKIINELIAQDPRPAYRQSEINSVFSMRYHHCDVNFFMNDDGVLVIADIHQVN